MMKMSKTQNNYKNKSHLNNNENNNVSPEQYFNAHCPEDNYMPIIMPKQNRIVIFGDIHGDFQLLRKLLIMSGVAFEINGKFVWKGEQSYVVQVGDQIDRCRLDQGHKCNIPNDENSDIKILELFTDLDKQARQKNGRVISLLGNHELMNVDGFLQYVSPEGFKGFDKFGNRFNAFKPGKHFAKFLGCTRLPAAIIGSHLFVHGGIINSMLGVLAQNKTNVPDLELIAHYIRKWLLGDSQRSYISHLLEASERSMFWTRLLGNLEPGLKLSDARCVGNISDVLSTFKINDIIIGHTPQSFKYADSINSTCDNKVWRVDVGSSAAFDNFDNTYLQTKQRNVNRNPQYLEILNDNEYLVYRLENDNKITVLKFN